MRLTELAAALPAVVGRIGDDVDVNGIVADSRLAESGSLFVAVPGVAVDGHQFVAEAIERGAVAVVGEAKRASVRGLLSQAPGLPYVQVANSREAWGWLCAAWYGFPSRELTVIGVTGTDGKTTTVSLIESILTASGALPGMVSTVSAHIGSDEIDTGLHVTTPDPPDVQSYLDRMVKAGATHAVLETTSEGLAQHRVSGCDFDVAVLTNITHEHISAHGSFEAYQNAKASLFEGLSRSTRKPGVPKVAVLNRDDKSYGRLVPIAADCHITYGLSADSQVRARNIRAGAAGTQFAASTPLGEVNIESMLVGEYNVGNILAAVATGIGLGIDLAAIREGVAATRAVPGRMERIEEGQDFVALVDFAHTPNALRQALRAARTMVSQAGRVIVVFGSAGLRDAQKRGMMGREAGKLADYVIITAEDPRTESLDAIMAECLAGAQHQGKTEGTDAWCVADRGHAISVACGMARAGDVVIVCGKGHEQSMCFGAVEYPWDDRQAVRLALRGQTLDSLPTAALPG
jgi:UDP-N-acetylmuramoyl-L-alanyl-D-glutamate--2,6-diaminopimelate ligase